MVFFVARVLNFVIFGSKFRILDISSWPYIQFLMRNPMFRLKLSNSAVQRPKNRKNKTRNNLKIEGLDFLSYDFLSYVSTVFQHWSQTLGSFLEALGGSKSSGRPEAKTSTYDHWNRTTWYWFMTKKTKTFTAMKLTTNPKDLLIKLCLICLTCFRGSGAFWGCVWEAFGEIVGGCLGVFWMCFCGVLGGFERVID